LIVAAALIIVPGPAAVFGFALLGAWIDRKADNTWRE
jgi:hypothetical protein